MEWVQVKGQWQAIKYEEEAVQMDRRDRINLLKEENLKTLSELGKLKEKLKELSAIEAKQSAEFADYVFEATKQELMIFKGQICRWFASDDYVSLVYIDPATEVGKGGFPGVSCIHYKIGEASSRFLIDTSIPLESLLDLADAKPAEQYRFVEALDSFLFFNKNLENKDYYIGLLRTLKKVTEYDKC